MAAAVAVAVAVRGGEAVPVAGLTKIYYHSQKENDGLLGSGMAMRVQVLAN